MTAYRKQTRKLFWENPDLLAARNFFASPFLGFTFMINPSFAKRPESAFEKPISTFGLVRNISDQHKIQMSDGCPWSPPAF
jgi:hypothetical protein